jgi:hypothetical protein
MPDDVICDVIKASHLSVGHSGRDRHRKDTGSKYANITIAVTNLLIYLYTKSATESKERITVLNPFCIPNLTVAARKILSTCRINPTERINSPWFDMIILLHDLQIKRAKEVAYQLKSVFLRLYEPYFIFTLLQ